MLRITPGHNGWTDNAPKILRAIHARQKQEAHALTVSAVYKREREAELQYYEDNNCYPKPTGYFGTESDSHFDER